MGLVLMLCRHSLRSPAPKRMQLMQYRPSGVHTLAPRVSRCWPSSEPASIPRTKAALTAIPFAAKPSTVWQSCQISSSYQRAFVRVSCPAHRQDRPHKSSKMQADREEFSLLRTSSEQWEEATQTAANWRQRAVGNLRESLLLTYTTLVESVLITVADALRLSTALNWLTPRLETGIGALTGKNLAVTIRVYSYRLCPFLAAPCDAGCYVLHMERFQQGCRWCCKLASQRPIMRGT